MDLKSYHAAMSTNPFSNKNRQCKPGISNQLLIAGDQGGESFIYLQRRSWIPEIRYIDFFSDYGHELWMSWTIGLRKLHLEPAENNKINFRFLCPASETADAIIPSAISSSDHGGVEIGKYILWACRSRNRVLGFYTFIVTKKSCPKPEPGVQK